MTGGDVNNLITMNASTFNMSAGNISIKAQSYDSSIINLSGGSIRDLFGYGESDVTLSGSIQLTGECCFYHYSTVNISETSSVTLQSLYLWNKSSGNITGGSIDHLYPLSDETVKISGGVISDIRSGPEEMKTTQTAIIGYGITKVPYGGAHNYGQITGYWNDDTAFSIDLWWGVYSGIVVYDGVIPPDCIDQPESDLTDDCKVTFADFSKMANEWLADGTQ